jgi:hypothetical protein
MVLSLNVGRDNILGPRNMGNKPLPVPRPLRGRRGSLALDSRLGITNGVLFRCNIRLNKCENNRQSRPVLEAFLEKDDHL